MDILLKQLMQGRWQLMTALLLKEQFLTPPPQKKKNRKGVRICFIFGESQLDHNSNLYLKQL